MRKKQLFFLVTILLPFLLLFAIESFLRFIDYGGNLDLVTRKEVLGRQFYAINRSVAKRYFTGNTTTIPEPPEDLFTIDKDTNTVRIFCLGESTMAGFPYEFNATAPAFLEANLRDLLPGRTIEVVNVGLSAVGTFVVRDFIDELLNYEPDLFVVYVGHNEFYGAFGPASSVGASFSPWVTDLTIKLVRFKTFLALRDLVTSFQWGDVNHGDATLMEQMVDRQSVPFQGEIYNHGREMFSTNLERIIDTAQDAGVPLMFSALVSNIADQPPFVSVADSSLPPKSLQDFRYQCSLGDSLLKASDPSGALQAFQSAISIESSHAGAWYGFGQAQRLQGQSLRALRSLTRAKDLDALRFRASDEFQHELRRVCRARGVPVSAVDSAFASESPLGLPGNNLFLEHLHPNLPGYALLARTWSQTLAENTLLPQMNQNQDPVSRNFFGQNRGVTAFDTAVGRIRIGYLTHRWPFRQDNSYSFIPQDSVESIALRYVRKEVPWQAARYETASYYVRRQRFDLAREEAATVAMVLPFSYEPLLRIGDYFLMEGKKTEAEHAYRECLRIENNPYAHAKLGLMHLHENRFEDAISALNNSFFAEGKTNYRLTAEMAASNRYLLGFAYARQQRKSDAIRELRNALTIDPGHPAALDLLSQLEAR